MATRKSTLPKPAEVPFELLPEKAPEPDIKAKFRVKNTLIQSRYELSILEQKLVLMYLSEMRAEEDLCRFVFPLKRVTGLLGLQDTNDRYKLIREAVIRLRSRVLLVKLDDGRELITGWIQEGILDAEERRDDGTLTLSVSPTLRPFLLDLQVRYTEFTLADVMGFRGTYALRFYEIIMSFRHLERDGVWAVNLTMKQIRTMFDWGPKEYTLAGNINLRIMKPAFIELNDRSPAFHFTWEPVKEGVKTTGYTFVTTRIQKKAAGRAPKEIRHEFDVLKELYEKASPRLKAMIKTEVKTMMAEQTFQEQWADGNESDRQEAAESRIFRAYADELRKGKMETEE